jgi:arylsulfatase A-like enzyme
VERLGEPPHGAGSSARQGLPRWSWGALALWTALALAAARIVVLFAMARFAHGEQLQLVWMRLSSTLLATLAAACAIALVWSPLAIAGLARGASSRKLALTLAWTALWAATFLLCIGRLSGDRSLRVGLETFAGRMAWIAILLATCALAAVLVLGLKCAPSFLRRPALGLALPLALGALGVVGLQGASRAARGAMTGTTVVGELLLDEEALEVVRARADRPPSIGVISPSPNFRVDGADLPACILPPPAEVRFQVPGSNEPLWLTARAGLDASALGRADLAGARVRFELEVDGQSRFTWEADLGAERTTDTNGWRPVGSDGGLEIEPLAALTLRTRVLDAQGNEVVPAAPLDVGFGELTLARRSARPREAASASRPNIVLIVMDTQRADRLSTYGYARPTSPQLERLARRGLLFENALATSSWTWPSTASILTGMLPQEHGVLDDSTCFLAHSLDTLAERLQEQGYTTAAWSANPLVVPDKNFDQGFETFEHRRGHFRASADFMPAALDWLGHAAGTRFFLYLHLADPHVPHLPLAEGRALLAADVPAEYAPTTLHDHSEKLLAGQGFGPAGELRSADCVSPDVQRWMSEMYDACVWTGDHWVGRVLDRLAELGLEDETIVVFTSDHGEELLEHGLLGHGQTLFGELVHVPLVIAGPGIPAGERRTDVVSNRHLGATLARLGGTTLGAAEDALDLIADSAPRSPVLLSTRHGWWNGRHRQPLLGARSGDLVLHFAPQGGPWGSTEPARGGEVRLYDLSSDPRELRDLAGEQPEAVERLREWIVEQVAELEARRRAPAVRAGEATLEMLRQIGYLGN